MPLDRAAALLITIRARKDVDFPDHIFVTMQRHRLTEVERPPKTVTTATISDTLDVVERWLESL